MATALAYAQPEPSYDPVAIGASGAFHASLARQFAADPLTAAMDDAFAAIDAMNERRAFGQSLNDQAVAIADAEVGPRVLKVTLPCDPQGFVAKARHNSAWTAVWRREMRRLVQAERGLGVVR